MPSTDKRTFQASKSAVKKSNSNEENPFKMPPDTDIFLLREREKQRKFNEREHNKILRVHEKITHNSKLVDGMKAGLRPQVSDEEEAEEDDTVGPLKNYAVKEDKTWTIAVTRDRRIEKESLKDYIEKKREMFLVQYSLGVKREEMKKLEEVASAEKKRIEQAEKFLEEDAALFDEFLKENDSNSVQAVKLADEETKKKTDKVVEIKKINTQIMILKSDITKMEEQLKEYQLYKVFLDKVTPQSLKEKNLERDSSSMQSRLDSAKTLKSDGTKSVMHVAKQSATPISMGTQSVNQIELKKSNEDDDEDEDLQLYFSDPQQLLDIFLELEESNLSLITNSQDTEEALEDMKQTINKTRIKMERETENLRIQITNLNEEIKREVEKENDLKLKASYFSYGEFKPEEQDKMLKELKEKVEEVYRNCIGDNEANIDTLQMLTNIENKLEELFQRIEQMPPEKVEEAERAKEKERRMKQREERMIEQKKNQEERIRKALERAQAAPKKNTGRRLMVRSKPPTTVKVDKRALNQASKNDEELAYFFT